MIKSHKILAITMVLCVIGMLLSIADFLALHDIKNEYVSTQVLESLGITLSGDLPEWTSTQGEWKVVGFSYLFRFIFFIFCAIVLYELVKRGRKNIQRNTD